jgi:hypothetical protein
MPLPSRAVPALFLLVTAAFAQAPEAAPDAPPQRAPHERPEPPQPPGAMAAIGREELLAHATFLASDDLRGRLTGTAGQLAAAKYIAGHFAKLGLEPLGDVQEGERTWLQHYPVTRRYVADGASLRLGALELTDGFAVLGGGTFEVATTGTLRFCGLGRLRGPNADVAEDVDLTGAVAVVVARSPRGEIDRPLGIERQQMMSFSRLTQLAAIARAFGKRGAAAVLFVQLDDRFGFSDVLNYVAVAPGKPSLAARFPGADTTMAVLERSAGGGGGLPAMVLSVAASEKVLGELGLAKDAVAKLAAGDGERPQAKADVPAALAVKVARDEQATACNVVAVLRGSDPALAAEAVVYSAHMDHVGTRIDGDVFNGADDNASGSAGLLAIATAYAKAERRPARSVIFLSVSGEELGLWGSAWFADNPPWDAAGLVANVNTDMIGRSGPESGPTEVTVTPSHRHARFSSLVQDAARFGEALGCTFTDGDKYFERSDHYNFAKKGIPVVFFCNGEHEDYHRVGDHADKLDGEKMERIARLAFWTGWSAADARERPRTLGRRADWR